MNCQRGRSSWGARRGGSRGEKGDRWMSGKRAEDEKGGIGVRENYKTWENGKKMGKRNDYEP